INIPGGLNNVSLVLTSFTNQSQVWSFNPCNYAFIEEEGLFNFNSSSFEQLNYTQQLPMVLNWAIGNESDFCDQAQNRKDFACKANSKCVNRAINGSADIDDCKASNPCLNGECVNLPFPQNYTCSCHKGYKKDRTNDHSCIKDDSSKIVLLLTVSLGVSMGLLVFFLGISWICWGMKKREFIKLKEKHFKENGGLLLLQQLATDHGSSMKTTKIFTADELEKATNNYHESRILGEGGNGTV
ncbi:PREDICTED: wall-associated receptor kinase 2-like, partial [Fragaria vesca subsp. vesca]